MTGTTYLVSLLVVVAGVLVPAVLAMRLGGPARRTVAAARQLQAAVAEGAGPLRAQWAALRLEVARRRTRGDGSTRKIPDQGRREDHRAAGDH